MHETMNVPLVPCVVHAIQQVLKREIEEELKYYYLNKWNENLNNKLWIGTRLQLSII